MPVSWWIDGNLVRLESAEESTVQGWRDALDAAFADPQYREGMAVLHDMRRLGLPSALEAQERVDVIETCTRAYKVARWATIVDRDAGDGIPRMGEAMAVTAHVHFRVFRDPLEAEAWARGAD